MQIICHGLKEEDFPVEFTSEHKIFFGRDESNSIVVVAEGVSRFHAILIEDGDELFLQDNDSLNGTFLNYNQIRGRRKLVNGDIIQIGARLIKVVFTPEQNIVILDFVPPEKTEVLSQTPAAVPPGSVEPERTLVADTDNERTMVAPETMISRSPSSDHFLFSGNEIGKYTIIKLIGKGGMGEVYLAKHRTLGICRAIKALPKETSDGNAVFLERFIREAKVASEVRHPNVVAVMDVETDSDCGFSYIVMEYVDGGSLRNSLSVCKRLSEEQAVVIVEAVASALQAAEEHHIVHRDIKPDNIMFTRRGEVKLADLGIAKIDGKDTDITKTNIMIGTPAYVSPEQARNAKGVDARADIYSLGATFYEMLTGQQPYPGENSIEIMHKLFLTPVPDPRKINPDVSAASAAIVMKMLAKNPKDRFQNATELLAMMERTFPPHTPGEVAELVRKAIAGENQSNTSFSSGIVSSQISLWWSGLRHKWFVVSSAGFVLAICVLCILFLFLDKHATGRPVSDHDTGTKAVETVSDMGATPAMTAIHPVQGTKYRLRIATTPDSDIRFISPDGRMALYSADHSGTLLLPELNPGTYQVRISQEGYRSINQEVELEKDMTLNLPLKAATKGDPLLVTTALDVVNPNDDMNSLREALEFIQNHKANATVSFADDYEIRLSSSLLISSEIVIDGKGNDITIIGPEEEPLFRLLKPGLTLKNLSLISDYSGEGAAILDVSSRQKKDSLTFLWSEKKTDIPDGVDMIELISVKDGGKADLLWNISGVGMLLDGKCQLHRLSGSNGASVRIEAESVLEDMVMKGSNPDRVDGDVVVYGTLKNATVSDYADIYIRKGGTGENLTIKKNGFLENASGGTIEGLRVESETVGGYQTGSALTGTVFISGSLVASEKQKKNDPVVNGDTDVIFDLTERTAESSFKFEYTVSDATYIVGHGKHLDNIKAFRGARSYTIQIREDQPMGTYKLVGNADNFDTPMSLRIGNTVYRDVLFHEKSFSVGNISYTLLHVSEDNSLSLEINRAYETMVVSTGKDTVDPNDGVDSLREALDRIWKEQIRAHVVFSEVFTIELSSSLLLSNDIILDGEEHKPTIIGPGTEPMFRVEPDAVLSLKNLTLLSDYSGDDAGIMNVSSGKVKLISVNDGGNAKWLWSVESIIIAMNGSSHLHRFHGSKNAVFQIWDESAVLEDSIIESRTNDRSGGDFAVVGTLKNVTATDSVDIILFKTGKAENITVERNGFLNSRDGTTSGLTVKFGGIYGYQQDSILKGRVSIGGAAMAPEELKSDHPVVRKETDLIFDLTERTGGSGFSFSLDYDLSGVGNSPRNYVVNSSSPIIDNMKAFTGAGSYSVLVRTNQTPGKYKLAGNASAFKSPISLKIGDNMYSNVLSIGKSFMRDQRIYSLSLTGSGELVLTIK